MVISSFVKKLLFSRQLDIDNTISVLGMSKVMVSPNFIVKLSKNPEPEHIYQLAEEVFSKEGKQLKTKIGSSSQKLMDICMNLMSTYGLGAFRMIRSDSKNLIFNVTNSPFSKSAGRTNKKECHFIAGALAGAMSEIYNKKTECQETICESEGKSFCQFMVKFNK